MILVAVGANLISQDGRPPYQHCNEAVDALRALDGLGLAVVAVSRWYRSAPVPRSDQPDYVNGIVRLRAVAGGEGPDPAALLDALQAIETAHGRVRSVPNAARTLDLDLVAMGACIRDAPDPILPHPRAHLRAFVLLPLRDVAPDWRHPVLGRSVGDLISALPRADLTPDAISVLP